MFENLKKADPEIYESMKRELKRQQRNIELIASENIVSVPVMETMGSHLTNKYAEGYSGKRYYGGCEYIDEVETLAIDRIKKYLEQNMLMFNLILEQMQILVYILLC